MKKNYLALLLTSLLLAGCGKQNNEPQPSQTHYQEETTEEIITPFSGERLSYREYLEKYGEQEVDDNHTEINSEAMIPSTPEAATNNEIETVNHQDNLLSTFSTPLKDNSEDRVNNIEIVCKRLNHYTLQPGETFSYNEVTGPFGPDDGFEEATILLSDGTKTDGYGGGVCQLSSTLYNVVKNIKNVDITERHHHSTPVSYVPKGEDATVSLQSNLDFKFVNHTDYPIQFEAQCANNQVTVWAYRIR